jgi:hypothetical protein
MNQFLRVCGIASVLFVLMAPHVMAAWSSFANVNRENESEYNIRVDVSFDGHQQGQSCDDIE